MKYLFFILLLANSLQATHIVGGNFNVEQVGRNQFSIELVLYRDCRNTGDPNTDPIPMAPYFEVKAFDLSDSSAISFTLITPPGKKLDLGDNCYDPPNLCVEEYILQGFINLPDSPDGYIIAMHICCRNSIVSNIMNPLATGMTITAQIPDPALVEGNNTPRFTPYPSTGFFCLNYVREFDFSAVDDDGDSLVYELVTPYSSPPSTSTNPFPILNPPPYAHVSWAGGYSLTNIIPGNPTLTMDPLTGILSIKPSELGLYVFAYTISEYRNGVKIGEVRRDLQMLVLHCETNTIPTFTEPQQAAFTTSVDEDFCFQVRVEDINTKDSIFLTSSYSKSIDKPGSSPPTSLKNFGVGSAGGNICWTPTCSDAREGQILKIALMAVSHGCDNTDTIYEEISVSISALPPDLEPLFPNIFTPNGDGINDQFKLRDPLVVPCLQGFEFKIFNRWGVLVYQNSGTGFSWDGNFNNREVSPGVYFYLASGTYGGQSFEYKNFLTLIR